MGLKKGTMINVISGYGPQPVGARIGSFRSPVLDGTDTRFHVYYLQSEEGCPFKRVYRREADNALFIAENDTAFFDCRMIGTTTVADGNRKLRALRAAKGA